MNGKWDNRETFESAPTETKFGMIHDGLREIASRFEEGNKRIKTLEDRRLFDKVYSFLGGILGGFIAVIAKAAFWK